MRGKRVQLSHWFCLVAVILFFVFVSEGVDVIAAVGAASVAFGLSLLLRRLEENSETFSEDGNGGAAKMHKNSMDRLTG